MKRLATNNHSVFKLCFHMILVVKYRRKVLTSAITDRLKEIFLYIAPSYNITLKEWNFEADHIHILVDSQPNTSFSKFVNAYKSASSRLIKKEFSGIREQLWKEMFWSKSYCLLSVGGAPLEVLKKYIESQKGSEE